MPSEQRQHVVEKGYARLDGRLARPVDVQPHRDAGFFGCAAQFCPSGLHFGAFNQICQPNTKLKPSLQTGDVSQAPGSSHTTTGSQLPSSVSFSSE
jgi:hypothetical protein